MRNFSLRCSRLLGGVTGNRDMAASIAAIALAMVVAGCTGSRLGSGSPVDSPASSPATQVAEKTPTVPDGLSEAEAIGAARGFLSSPDQSAAVWATMPGEFGTVYELLAHRPNYVEQPDPAPSESLDRPTWGVQFKVSIEICGPAGTECQVRDGLRTVLIDQVSGEKLRMTAYAPPPGNSLPTPNPPG